MIIYKCRITGDEMLSDAYKILPVVGDDGEEVPGLMEIESQIVAKGGEEIDIGGGDAFGGGGADEAVDDTIEKVNNVVDETIGFAYTECPMGKKDLKEYLQAYCKQVRGLLKDDDKVAGPDVKAFTQSAGAFCKFLLTKAGDLEYYMTPAFNPEGSMAFSYYKDGALAPTFVYIKMGLLEEKC
ncbi:hypothetical protein TrST_g2977 [Triparma strigata]|uniref:TCTP domain-containing protein n=1 Tax=Triparma strigata TaxID=1606541 RepID=A0A9W7DYP3_9STRA|nr:hypothetical protein TrST_g2977 [Triparma strigata]